MTEEEYNNIDELATNELIKTYESNVKKAELDAITNAEKEQESLEEETELNQSIYNSALGQKVQYIILENLNRELSNLSISQVELAKKIGITKGMITKYKTFRTMPNVIVLTLLCRELGISADDILPTDITIKL